MRAGGVGFATCLSALCSRATGSQIQPRGIGGSEYARSEIKDDEDPLVRLKKERFNAALNEAKARFDLYKRGLTKLPDLIEVGERLFGAEVGLYDKPEDRVRVLQHQLDVYNEAEGNLEKQVKQGLTTQADLERLRYNKASLEIDLFAAKSDLTKAHPTPQPSPQ